MSRHPTLLASGGPSFTVDYSLAFTVSAFSVIYLWEYLLSLDFEWGFITRRKKMSWPMMVYLVGRYVALFSAILFIYLDVPLNGAVCRPDGFSGGVVGSRIYPILWQIFDHDTNLSTLTSQSTSSATLGFATLNLAIRAMAVWSLDWRVVVPLVILALGHWALIFANIAFIIITHDAGKKAFIDALFIYTIIFDGIIFFVTALKLFLPRTQRTQLVAQVLQDGLIYFLVTFIAALAAFIIFGVLSVVEWDLSALSMPAFVISSRLVLRLRNFTSSTPSLYVANQNKHQPSELAFHTTPIRNSALTGDSSHGRQRPQLDALVLTNPSRTSQLHSGATAISFQTEMKAELDGYSPDSDVKDREDGVDVAHAV
ncbi:hypothetical protein BXZ70DRAFT_1006948 [Cristinia sonorae]|uniref:Uncharacterized protein n=1 Tax=Cristinia sonorae TaxID=1940300 RepID=A0A8K0UQA4_9AGAR|nr:hypothetical protein BXZ70DRAFT_1006948 [Cristinia sonorae]